MCLAHYHLPLTQQHKPLHLPFIVPAHTAEQMDSPTPSPACKDTAR